MIRMILFVLGMLFSCQHKAVAIFRAKGHILTAQCAQLHQAELVRLQTAHMYRAKGQRPKRREALVHPQHCNCPIAVGGTGDPLLDFTPPYPLPTLLVHNEGTIQVSVHILVKKNHTFYDFYIALPVSKCLFSAGKLKSFFFPVLGVHVLQDSQTLLLL